MPQGRVAIRDVEILITWYGVNYAKKMQTDIQHWYKYSILRFWLPFEPNLFMLPPNQIDGSGEVGGMPSTFEEVADPFFDEKMAIYRQWHQKHKQYVRIVKKKWEERERQLISRRRKSWRRNWPDR